MIVLAGYIVTLFFSLMMPGLKMVNKAVLVIGILHMFFGNTAPQVIHIIGKNYPALLEDITKG